jgi:DNA mismatch repair protein MutS2
VGVSGASSQERSSPHPGTVPRSSPRHRAPAPPAGGVSILTKAVPAELKLIGLTVEEARERVEKLLDDAALSDRREIRIIHGFGEGKLRKAVAQMLEGHPLVSSWRLGGPSEGGGGATVVELKD